MLKNGDKLYDYPLLTKANDNENIFCVENMLGQASICMFSDKCIVIYLQTD